MWRSWPSRSGTNSWFPASDHRAGPTVDATSRSQPSDSSRAERAGRRIPDSLGFGGRGGCPDAETRGTVGLYGGSLRGSHFSSQSKWMGRPRTAPPTRPRSSRTVGGVPSRVGRPLAHCGNRAPTLSEAAVRSISSSSTSPHRGKRTSAPSMDRLNLKMEDKSWVGFYQEHPPRIHGVTIASLQHAVPPKLPSSPLAAEMMIRWHRKTRVCWFAIDEDLLGQPSSCPWLMQMMACAGEHRLLQPRVLLWKKGFQKRLHHYFES
ncbi:hypothetical protein OPV22_008095 [Ensete ventricosum]|uniref:Uncharacterized protein n=1 Tax=Ensete ventricosum TaxID=4639 RepID=A0AAV8R254_ENSVE|nr:hypothetical protein OPV22_008095 [Ensete ventricosum]